MLDALSRSSVLYRWHDEVTRHVNGEAAAGLNVAPPAGVALTSGLASKGLTTQQPVVLSKVADAKNDRQIAAELVLGEKTVGRHMENIFTGLGVASRAAFSVVALRQGLA